MKRIALVTCASNYERYGNIVRSMRSELDSLGEYVFYVLSCYSVFDDETDFSKGDANIYRLLDLLELDGCIIEANLGSNVLTEIIVSRLRSRGIPTLTINLQATDTPCLHLETREAGVELMEHLIVHHGCRRINLNLSRGNSILSRDALEFYQNALQHYGIEYDERRVLLSPVSVRQGRLLYEQFDRRGVMKDADAVVCVHDVCAIGLCMEMKDRGFQVPRDLRVCSMNFSGNSAAFRPQITGIDRMDQEAAVKACKLMDRMIKGESIPSDNTYDGTVRYGESCGCGGDVSISQNEGIDWLLQRVVINKVEAGGQIGQMMRFNALLEEVESLDQLADHLHEMMRGIGCEEYFCCLNERALNYIENRTEELDPEDQPFDPWMIALTGFSKRTGRVKRVRFPLMSLMPAECSPGDIVLVMPITNRNQVFGYVVLLNNEMPLEVYNYRISQENIGSSIENLHRQTVLRSRNEELDRLHMQDQLTGLYNRFALKRFNSGEGKYAVAMLDLDGLKTINDNYGHLAGNHAICLAAQAIRESCWEDDLVIRYGGDEFVVLSGHAAAEEAWIGKEDEINQRLRENACRQELPYEVAVSAGVAIGEGDVMKNIEQADRIMYEHKKRRKAGRG